MEWSKCVTRCLLHHFMEYNIRPQSMVGRTAIKISLRKKASVEAFFYAQIQLELSKPEVSKIV